MHINQQKICQELGLSRDQFYRGLKLIKQHFPNLKLYRTTALVGEFESAPSISSYNNATENEPVAPATNSVVETANSSVNSPKPVAPTANRVVETATDAPPKPPKTKADSDSPDLNSHNKTDTLFQSDEVNQVEEKINQLTPEERENFFNFCEKKAYQLPTVPTLVNRWIQSNLGELWGLWLKSRVVVQNKTDVVDFQKWYDMMKEMGHVRSQRKDSQGNQLVQDNCGYWLPWEKYLKSWTMEKVQKAYKRTLQR